MEFLGKKKTKKVLIDKIALWFLLIRGLLLVLPLINIQTTIPPLVEVIVVASSVWIILRIAKVLK